MKKENLSVGKWVLIVLILAILIGGPAVILAKLGVFDFGGGGSKNFGKAEFTEVTQEELVVTEQWGTTPLNQIIVVLKDNEKKSLIKSIVNDLDGEIVGEIEYINLYQIAFEALDEKTFNQKLEAIQKTDGVETAFPNAINSMKDLVGKPCTPLTDPVFDQEENRRHYEMIGMGEAWKIIKASKIKLNNVKVGVLDSAIYSGSTEVGGKVKVEGDRTEDPETDNIGIIVDGGLNHGTMVTHVIGADADNNGVSGVAGILGNKMTINVKNLYDGVRLAPPAAPVAGVEKDVTVGTTGAGVSVTIKALTYLQKQVESGAKVINCSYGPEKPGENNKWINAAYKKFFTKMAADHPDVIFVAAAGNEADVDGAITSENYYPAGIPLPNIVTVGALNNDGTRASFSNFASGDGEVTLSAPGVNMVMGVDKDGKPIKSSGTSFATPQVTATVALLQSINPKLTATEIKDILVKSSQGGTINKDQSTLIPEGMGAGLLRVDNAVLMVINALREKEGKDPFTMESLLNMSLVKLTAKGGGTTYKVSAVLPEILDGSTTVKITVTGQHAMKGNSSQTLKPNEAAEWTIELGEPSITVKVVRSDTETCSTLVLNQGNFEGKWDTTFTITEDYFIPKLAEAIGTAIEDAVKEMGCEVSEGENGEKVTSTIGMTNDSFLIIKKLDEKGTLYSLNSEQKNPDAEGLDLTAISNNMEGTLNDDGSAYFLLESTEEGMALHSEIVLTLVDEKTITGTYKFYMVGTSENITFTEADYLAGTLMGTKVE